jgi:hypothetical protein
VDTLILSILLREGVNRPGMSGDFIRWKDNEVSWDVHRSIRGS